MDQHSIWRTSLMSIQRFFLGDKDIPLGGYINAIREWFEWATSTSENWGPGEHPLTVSHGDWFKYGEKDNVIFVGTHWDGRELVNLCRSCECESGKSLLINIISAAISPEEHPEQFPKLQEALKNPRDIINRAIDNINHAQGAVCIRKDKQTPEWFFTEDLDRIKPQDLLQLEIAPHIMSEDSILYKGGKITAACDGLWLFLKELDAGNYTIHINARSPMFNGYDSETFHSQATYDLTVK